MLNDWNTNKYMNMLKNYVIYHFSVILILFKLRLPNIRMVERQFIRFKCQDLERVHFP